MARPKGKDTGRLVYWQVFTQVHVYMVEASAREDVIPTMLKKLGHQSKPWLGRDWRVKLPKPDEVERHLRQHSQMGQVSIANAVKRQEDRMHLHFWEEQ
jgi:hypothetical protein